MEEFFEIAKKPKTNYNIKISTNADVYNLKEIKAIKDAVQEHLVFIGLDNANNVRNISLVGIGSGQCVNVDSKFIVRTALVSACEKVILVHNHPSNSLKPSNADKHVSDVTNKLLNLFNINLLDHIIVTENEYFSMAKSKEFDQNYKNDKTEYLDKALLIEENNILKNEINELKENIENQDMFEDEYEG